MTPEQFQKLPAYARQEIETLRGNVSYWQKKATAGPEESDTFAGGFPMYETLRQPTRPLGKGERIHFRTAAGWIEAYVDQHGRLIVRTERTLAFLPSASNSGSLRILEES